MSCRIISERVLLAALLWAAPGKADWISLDSLDFAQGNLDLTVRPDTEGVVKLRVEGADGTAATVRIGADKSALAFETASAWARECVQAATCRPYPQMTKSEEMRLLLRRRSRGWVFYLDDIPLVETRELFTGPVQLAIAGENLPQADSPDVFIQKIDAYVFQDDFLIPEDAEYPLMQWEKLVGDWQIHTVTQQLAGTRGAAGNPGRAPSSDRSPNFYSISGSGTNGIIATGTEFLDHYRIGAAVQHNSGTNGLVFLLRPNGTFHALTLEDHPDGGTLVLTLWRGETNSAQRDILAAAEAELLPGQWLRLQAKLYDDVVVCSVNRSEIMRTRISLPPGGQFGLFANSSDATRFDDVSAESHEDFSISVQEDIRRHIRFAPEQVKTGKGAIEAASSDSSIQRQEHHFVVLKGAPARISVGGQSGIIRSVEAVFRGGKEPRGPIGVSLGKNTNGAALYSLTCMPQGQSLHFRLLQDEQTVLDTFSIPSPDRSSPVALRLEARESGDLFGMADEALVVRASVTNSPAGPAGISAYPGARISLPILSSADLDLRDHTESVQNFVIDPFMRHWASPEGQWVPFPDGLTWYRGDVFGGVDVTLPLLNGSELHMAVAEGTTNGACMIRTEGDKLHIRIVPEEGAETRNHTVLSLADLPERDIEEIGKVPVVTVHLRDHCFWISLPDRELFGAHLQTPPSGTRMRIGGLSTDALRHVQVVRDNVLDVLFKTSLSDWTINGGRWEIVNRFHCDPRWSHMNGENNDGLAALWSHYEFSGDFCAEMFVGARHGWYHRIGDFNMTVLNQRDSPGSGYTAICTGWDPDESSLSSRLLRNGETLAESSAYAAPRHREGNARKGHEPLIASGRDVHGAWYSVKLRRIGDRLMYSFDNKPIIETRDPNPLSSGRLGIWTFRSSMMVARVRVAADKIAPRKVISRRMDPGLIIPTRTVTEETVSREEKDPLLFPLQASRWQPADDVSHPELTWLGDERDPVMLVRSRLGGGTFLAAADLPFLSTEKLAGFRFEIARDADAAVNFAFSLGSSGDAAFVPAAGYSYALSGTTLRDGPRRISGSQPIPASGSDNFPEKALWTKVFVPLPINADTIAPNARVDGFGNLQPSDVQQGLGGNPPGAAYAVRGFAPVWRGVDPACRAYNLNDEARQRISERNRELDPGGTGEARVDLPGGLQAAVYWEKPPEIQAIDIAFSGELPDTLVFSAPDSNPWRPPAGTTVQVNDTAVPLLPHRSAVWKAELPRPRPWPEGVPLQVRVLTNTTVARKEMLLPVDAPTNFPPVLSRLDWPGHYNSFAHLNSGPANEFKGAASAAILRGPPPRGSILRFDNAGSSARLHGILGTGIDLLANPLLSFHYRADRLARTSLRTTPHISLAFSEPFVTTDIQADPAVLDEQRHRYGARAVPAQGEFKLAHYQALADSALTLRSNHRVDQTGRYSWMEIDSLVCGPSLGPDRPLRFQALFSDIDAVQNCAYAITPADGDANAAEWISFTNGTPVLPPSNTLSNGFYTLHLRAGDTRGANSEILSLPFLYDDQAPSADLAVEESRHASNGSRLALRVHSPDSLSPIRFDDLSMSCDDESIPVKPGDHGLSITPEGTRMVFDWPLMLSSQLDKSIDGQILRVEIDGISDGAGNSALPAQTSIPVDYASDKTPPTARALQYASKGNPFWMQLALGDFASTAFFTANRYTRVTHVSDHGAYGAVELTPAHPRSRVTHSFGKTPWNPEKHPFLAISLCATHATIKEDEAAVTITLISPDKEAFSVKGKKTDRFDLPLVSGPSGDLASLYADCITGSVDWTTNRWNDLIIDVRKIPVLRSDKVPAIHTVELAFANQKELRVRIRAVAVLSTWEENHTLRFNAHDASGMGGIVWQGGETGEMELRPARLPPPEDGSRWHAIRLRDKAGNTTPPIHLPSPPEETGVPQKPDEEEPNDNDAGNE